MLRSRCSRIRAIEKVGHDLKVDALVAGAPRRRRCGASASTRCSPATCSMRRGPGHPLETVGARASRLQGAHRGRRAAARARRRSPLADVPPDAALDLRRRARRPGAAARRHARGRCSSRTGSTRVYRDLERPLIPVLVAIERAGVRIDVRGAGRAVAARRARAGGAERADLRAGRRVVQHQLAAAAVARSCSTSCSCRRSSGTSRRGRRRRPSKCSRSWRSRTTCRG